VVFLSTLHYAHQNLEYHYMEEHKCTTCGKNMKGHCAECESEASEQGKCADCGSENRAMKCEGCNEGEATCTCPAEEVKM
jgi:hypothetical protein